MWVIQRNIGAAQAYILIMEKTNDSHQDSRLLSQVSKSLNPEPYMFAAKVRPAAAHDVGCFGPLRPKYAQLMLMMLAVSGLYGQSAPS